MAGPGLPVNIDTTYADVPADPSVAAHQQHHDLLHGLANRYDKDAVPTAGQVPLFNGSLYVPSTPAKVHRIKVTSTGQARVDPNGTAIPTDDTWFIIWWTDGVMVPTTARPDDEIKGPAT